MKLYLAGPMRGLPMFNFPAFHEAAGRLRGLGHDVYNPAEQDEQAGFDPARDEPKPLRHYMLHDLPAVLGSDAVAALPGWGTSQGARLEVHVARECGIPVLDADTLQPAGGSVCEEAGRLVHGPKQASYGHPAADFARTAIMWTALLAHKLEGGYVDAEDVWRCMVAVKLSREVNRPGRDNRVDIAGYAETGQLLAEAREAQPDVRALAAILGMDPRAGQGESVGGSPTDGPAAHPPAGPSPSTWSGER